MAVTVKKAILWRTEVQDRPGALAQVLEPLAFAKADLEVVMGYRLPGDPARAVFEVWPVGGKKLSEAAEGAGLSPSHVPAVVVNGDNRAGLGHRIARALADEGVNLTFLVAQVLGRRYSAVFGFASDADATRAVGLVRKAASKR